MQEAKIHNLPSSTLKQTLYLIGDPNVICY